MYELLGKTIIEYALRDIESGNEKDKLEAQEFIASEDFDQWAQLCFMNPDMIRERVLTKV